MDYELSTTLKEIAILIKKQLDEGFVYWSCISCGTEFCTSKTPNVNFTCSKCDIKAKS